MARHEKGRAKARPFSVHIGVSNRIAAEGGVAGESPQNYIIKIFGFAEKNLTLKRQTSRKHTRAGE